MTFIGILYEYVINDKLNYNILKRLNISLD